MNARDSEKLVGILEQIGYVEAPDEKADFVIYNTCTVRENANNKVYGRLGYLQGFKKKNPYMMLSLIHISLERHNKQNYALCDHGITANQFVWYL